MKGTEQRSRQPVLIANRGEIAIRIAKTCEVLGFEPIAVYSDADRDSDHVKHCRRAVHIGGSAPKESYLNVERIVAAAKSTGARFVHPGFGFLSERAHFVEACEKAGLVFVGPTAESMNTMGDKIRARQTIDQLGVPRIPGSAGALKTAQEAEEIAEKIGYPVLLKAAAGGGGKGMRRVDERSQIAAAFEGASREALSAFGDGSVYIEKWIVNPHHLEIQVFGDGKGGAVHLGERECSIQRRYQKIFEETPSPLLNRFPKTRERMFESALKVTSAIKYRGAGTLEFVGDEHGNFYFLEMNTRLQVEHPVSEWVTGVDLVAWQLLLAAGELEFPSIPERRGHAIEVRVYAEDPKTFLPSPGVLGTICLPSGPFVRVDSAFYGPGDVSMHYDPMIAKVSTWGADRNEALGRMRVALDQTDVLPPIDSQGKGVGSLKTNLDFLRRLVRNADVISGDTPTDLIAKNSDLTQEPELEVDSHVAVATALYQVLAQSGDLMSEASVRDVSPSAWAQASLREGVRR